MATVTYLGENYECSVAIKGDDYIHLLDENGMMIAAFDGVTNFSNFMISGANWYTPVSDNYCYVAVVREDGTIGKGGHLCSSLVKRGQSEVAFGTVTANKVVGAVYA